MNKSEKKEIKTVAKKKAKKVVKKQMRGLGGLHQFAINQSNYLRTIMDPVNFPGVKIPDVITAPSYTVQVLTKFLVTIATQTVSTVTTTGAGFIRTVGQAPATYATLVPSASVAATYASTSVIAGWGTQLQSQANQARLVSAKATITYLGSPNNAQGRFLLAFIPPNNQPGGLQNAVGVFTATIPTGLIVTSTFLADVPAAQLYAEARYVPIDPIALSYENTATYAIGSVRAAPSPSFLPTYGTFVGVVDGAVAGQSIEVNIWENYECVATSNLVNLVQPTPSLSDPIEMAVASNVISMTPMLPILQGTKDAQAKTAQAVSTMPAGTQTTSTAARTESKEGPSFMDKVFSGIGQTIDLGMKALPLVDAIGAML